MPGSIVGADTVFCSGGDSLGGPFRRALAPFNQQLVTCDRRYQRERNEKCRARPDLALRPNDAPLGLDDPFGDEKAESAPLTGGFVCLPVALKEVRQSRG